MEEDLENIMEDIVRTDDRILDRLTHERQELRLLLSQRIYPENMTEAELSVIANSIENTMENIARTDDEISELIQERAELMQSFISGFYYGELPEAELSEIDEREVEPTKRDLPPSIDLRRSKRMFEVGRREQEMFDPKGILGTEYLRQKYRRPKK